MFAVHRPLQKSLVNKNKYSKNVYLNKYKNEDDVTINYVDLLKSLCTSGDLNDDSREWFFFLFRLLVEW